LNASMIHTKNIFIFGKKAIDRWVL